MSSRHIHAMACVPVHASIYLNTQLGFCDHQEDSGPQRIPTTDNSSYRVFWFGLVWFFGDRWSIPWNSPSYCFGLPSVGMIVMDYTGLLPADIHPALEGNKTERAERIRADGQKPRGEQASPEGGLNPTAMP